MKKLRFFPHVVWLDFDDFSLSGTGGAVYCDGVIRLSATSSDEDPTPRGLGYVLVSLHELGHHFIHRWLGKYCKYRVWDMDELWHKIWFMEGT